jgi:maltose alpha-D-glucosyltransferase/alpha-amylase
MVTDEERDYMYQAYAADPQMRINVGIRRRLAPLLENSRRRVELLNSLLMSMPGTPTIYYGDEIGMGDNIYLGDRNGVRTPMQWTGDRNAGFSRADPARLYAPPIMDPVYGFQAINVEAQERAPYSLLNWMKRMIGLRKQTRVFGRGSIEFLPARNRKVLAYVRQLDEEIVLCVANLARSVQPVELDLSRFKGMVPVEMLGMTEFPRIGELPYVLTLGTYAFYWFRLQPEPTPMAVRAVPEVPTEVVEAPALLMGAAWDTLLDGNVRTLIERDLLSGFLQRQRWFGAKSRAIRRAHFVDWGLLRRSPQPLFLTIVEAEFQEGARERYFLPLTICPEGEPRTLEERYGHGVLARITGARKGVLFDGWLDDRFARMLLEAIERQEQVKTRRSSIRAIHTSAFEATRGSGDLASRRAQSDQSNTSIVYGDRLILKLFRRIEPGINPDFEVTRHPTERVGFSRVPAAAGALELTGGTEGPSTLAMLQRFVESQADGWMYATDEARRFFETVESRAFPSTITAPRTYTELIEAAVPRNVSDLIGGSLLIAETLGRRTAEMHIALASDTSDPAFAPEPFTRADLKAVAADAIGQAQQAFRSLETIDPANILLNRREDLLRELRRHHALEFTTSKIRVHGDYHLGQVLWSEGDFYILDFEGEPARPLAQRRMKQSALKDVAGMVRSFGYAAFAGLFTYTRSRADAFDPLVRWAEFWETWTTASFLRSYFGGVGTTLFVPREPAQRDELLRFFVLDKALYELNYELNNRPDWVRIPLRGVLRLIE